MQEKTWLRDEAEKEAKHVEDLINTDLAMDGVLPAVAATYIADAIEAVAKRFAERALRSVYDVDDHDRLYAEPEMSQTSDEADVFDKYLIGVATVLLARNPKPTPDELAEEASSYATKMLDKRRKYFTALQERK